MLAFTFGPWTTYFILLGILLLIVFISIQGFGPENNKSDHQPDKNPPTQCSEKIYKDYYTKKYNKRPKDEDDDL